MSLIDDILDVEADVAHEADDPRWLILKVHRAERERARLKDILREIQFTYQHRLDALDARAEEARESLKGWLIHENEGKAISFPDVGRASLRTVAESVKVTDRVMAEHIALELGFVKQEPDVAAAKGRVLERARETGEVLPGFEVVPERKTLVVGS